MIGDSTREFVVKNYGIPREWCYEPLCEEHTITIRDPETGMRLFNGTIKKLMETIEEEQRYFGEGTNPVSNI